MGVRFDRSLFPRKEYPIPMRRWLLWVVLLLILVVFMMRYFSVVTRRLGGVS